MTVADRAATALTPAEIARIEASAHWRAHRVEVFDLSVGKVIVKGQRALRPPGRHRALNLIARLVGVPTLRAVPVHGGARSQRIEISRLRELGDAGVPVPEVLHVADDYFVMRWLGPDHLAQVLDEQGAAALALWQEAAQALLAAHRQGQCLSQCFGRNVIVERGDTGTARFVGFIDFEDDPREVLTLAQAQVRDWLIYLQSTLWQLAAAPPAQIDATLHACLQAEDAQVRALFMHACRRLCWLRRLPTDRRLGRDTQAVQAVAAAAHRWILRAG